MQTLAPGVVKIHHPHWTDPLDPEEWMYQAIGPVVCTGSGWARKPAWPFETHVRLRAVRNRRSPVYCSNEACSFIGSLA